MPGIVAAFDGTDVKQDLSKLTVQAGTATSATDQSFTGPRSLKLSLGNPAVTARVLWPGVLADNRRMTLQFRHDASAPAGAGDLLRVRTAADAAVFQLSMNTSRVPGIIIVGGGGGTFNGTNALAADAWTSRIAIGFTIASTTSFTIKLYLNGVLEVTVTNATATLPNAAPSGLTFTAQGWGADRNAWFDDVFIDDGTDQGDPGDQRVNLYKSHGLLGVGNYPGYYALP